MKKKEPVWRDCLKCQHRNECPRGSYHKVATHGWIQCADFKLCKPGGIMVNFPSW